MSGNVGGRGLYEAIERNTAAVKDADSNRAKDSLRLRDVFRNALVQLRILNVHQAEMRDEVITEKDLEHIK